MEFKKFHDSSSDRKSSFESKTNSREHKIAEAKSANEFDTSRTALERIGFDGRPNLSREDGGHGGAKGIQPNQSWKSSIKRSTPKSTVVNDMHVIDGDDEVESVSTDTSSESDDYSEDKNDNIIIRSSPSKTLTIMDGASVPEILTVGVAIEANYKGTASIYSGKIIRVRFDGLYDILYDDGERELGVSKAAIRLKQLGNERRDTRNVSSTEHYTHGSKDKLTKMGKPTAAGRLSCTNKSINANDDKKQNVLVTKELKLGCIIEARYRGKNKYYPGKITRCRFDGSFDILYDDGERELGVAKELIKAKGGNSWGESVATIETETNENIIIPNDVNITGALNSGVENFMVGDIIKAQYGGKDKYYPGKITRCRFDGSFDILYDDGDCELGVTKELIKAKHESSETIPKTDSENLKVGDIIEARYRGNNKFYPGKITRYHSGRYDILYDDGEQESDVSSDLIRIKDISQRCFSPKMLNSSKKESRADDSSAVLLEDMNDSSKMADTAVRDREFTVGDRVECRYNGSTQSEYYPGMIAKAHSNGKYDIHYDDGDKDYGLATEHILKFGAHTELERDNITDQRDDPEGEIMENPLYKSKIQNIRHLMSVIEEAQGKIKVHLHNIESSM